LLLLLLLLLLWIREISPTPILLFFTGEDRCVWSILSVLTLFFTLFISTFLSLSWTLLIIILWFYCLAYDIDLPFKFVIYLDDWFCFSSSRWEWCSENASERLDLLCLLLIVSILSCRILIFRVISFWLSILCNRAAERRWFYSWSFGILLFVGM